MRIAIGSDHRGTQLKAKLSTALHEMGHEVDDVGTHESTSVDYPDIAAMVAGQVSSNDVDRGVLICGTGIGMAISANKFSGVRATPCHDDFEAEMCRRHNNVNVLCLGADVLGNRNVEQLVKIWLETDFEGGRHARRVDKIAGLEDESCS
jgi:ribose 5-phosphate isomerase B